jgi:hypothetical protein
MPPDTARYDHDVYAWTQHQAALLREGAVAELDLAHLAEEIESVGISQKHALGSHLKNLVLHLLKWTYQPAGRQTGHSWQTSITNARDEMAILIEDSPSLERELVGLLARRYPAARRLAHTETRLPLDTFPGTCPWTMDQLRDPDFWPSV